MKGIKHILIKNKRISYDFTLERNVSIISGNSATGKTTLFNLVLAYEKDKNNGVKLDCECECITLNNNDWEMKLLKFKSVICFIDEKSRFYKSKSFADAIKKTDNYYVIITRESIENIPYSVDSIYKIVGGKKHTLEKLYDLRKNNYWYNDNKLKNSDLIDNIVVEDSKSGFQLFSAISKLLNKKCLTSKGNSNLYKFVDNDSLLIADSAAYGCYIDKTIKYLSLYKNLYLYLPECIEWIILNSIVINKKAKKEIDIVLNNPFDYIESKKYFSHESFYVNLLKEITKNNELFGYSKTKLNKAFLNKNNLNNVINFIFKDK